jgi:protein-tyrosine phosphatase
MGNICRSPTAEGVFRHLVQQSGLTQHLTIDSAGTHNYHPNSPPDPRSQQHAARRGYDLSPLRARQLNDQDFEKFDLLLVMDWDNLALTEERCPPEYTGKLRRMTEFCIKHDATVIQKITQLYRLNLQYKM